MRKDFFNIVLGTESLSAVFFEETGNNVNYIVSVVNAVVLSVGEDNLGVLDLGHQHLSVSVKEGSHSNKHLVDQDAHSPPVNSHVVPLVRHHLGSQVLRSAAVTHSQFPVAQNLGQTVINDLEVASSVNQNVLEFQVSVHNSFSVKFTNSEDDLSCIEFHSFLIKSFLFLEDFVQLSSVNKWHNKVQSSLRLEQEVHSTQEGVVC